MSSWDNSSFPLSVLFNTFNPQALLPAFSLFPPFSRGWGFSPSSLSLSFLLSSLSVVYPLCCKHIFSIITGQSSLTPGPNGQIITPSEFLFIPPSQWPLHFQENTSSSPHTQFIIFEVSNEGKPTRTNIGWKGNLLEGYMAISQACEKGFWREPHQGLPCSWILFSACFLSGFLTLWLQSPTYCALPQKRKMLLPFFISSSNSLGKELINIVVIKGSPDWRVQVLKTQRDLWLQTHI